MIETTRGLVLRTRPLTETSLIVHWLTTDRGRIATVAKGERRPKSPFRGKLDLFYVADFSFLRSRSSELHNLREVSLCETNSFLRQNLSALKSSSYAAALLELTTETETPLPGMYELLSALIESLQHHAETAHLLPTFELKLLDHLGLRPDLANASLQPGTKLLIGNMMDSDWETLIRLKPSPAQQKQIEQFLHGFLIYHFGRLPGGTRG